MVMFGKYTAAVCILLHVCQGKQYHIQTDEGDKRYFKYETENGQYRKETRLQDGTVVGSYGWVAQDGYLHLYDYVADDDGYRIVRRRKINPEKTPSNSDQLKHPRISPQITTPMSPPPPLVESDNSLDGPLDSESIYFPNEVTGMMPEDNIVVKLSPVRFPVSSLPTVPPTLPPTSSVSIDETTKRPTFSDLFQVHNPFLALVKERVLQNNPNAQISAPDASAPEEVNLNPTLPPRSQDTKSPDRRPFQPLFYPTTHPKIEVGKYRTIYNLKKQFHVEKTLPNGDREGSHGYVDPFGILRITHYQTGPQGHRTQFQNRFVGKDFDASSLNH